MPCEYVNRSPRGVSVEDNRINQGRIRLGQLPLSLLCALGADDVRGLQFGQLGNSFPISGFGPEIQEISWSGAKNKFFVEKFACLLLQITHLFSQKIYIYSYIRFLKSKNRPAKNDSGHQNNLYGCLIVIQIHARRAGAAFLKLRTHIDKDVPSERQGG